uniref:PX domain-containing protein n=1 Tax=Hyaloperonospora arabidopsidis (strain Emoy2) TaxID=559515 RepID=M4BSF8_HYAAE
MKAISAHISGYYRSSFHAYTTEVNVDGHRWRLGLRYSKFHSFYDQLMVLEKDFDAEFPPKGTLFFTPKPEERQQQLEVFLQQVLAFYASKGYPLEIENLLCDLLKVPRHLRSPEHEDDDGSTGTESVLDEPMPDAKEKTLGEEEGEQTTTKLVASSEGVGAPKEGCTGLLDEKEKEDVVAAAELVPLVDAVATKPSSATTQTEEVRVDDDDVEAQGAVPAIAKDREEASPADEEAEAQVDTFAIAEGHEEDLAAGYEAETTAATEEQDEAFAVDDEANVLSDAEDHEEARAADEEEAREVTPAFTGDREEATAVSDEVEAREETPVIAEDCDGNVAAVDDAEVKADAPECVQDCAADDKAEVEEEAPANEEDRGEARADVEEAQALAEAPVIDREEVYAVHDAADVNEVVQEATIENTHLEDETDCVMSQSPVQEPVQEAVEEEEEEMCAAAQESTLSTPEKPSEQLIAESMAQMSMQSKQQAVDKRFTSENVAVDKNKNEKELGARSRVSSYFTVQLPKSMLLFIRQRCLRKTNLVILCVALLLPVVLGRC